MKPQVVQMRKLADPSEIEHGTLNEISILLTDTKTRKVLWTPNFQLNFGFH